MTSRLPTVGGDSGAWGTVLNDYLSVAHDSDGTPKGGYLATFSREGDLSIVTGVGRFLFPAAATVTGVIAAVNTAPTGASILLDLNKNGTTMFTTQGNRPAIVAAAYKTSSTAVPDVTSVAAGDYLSVDIDQAGSSVAGSDLVVQVIYHFA